MFHRETRTKEISLLHNKGCRRKTYKIENIVFLFEITLIGTIKKNIYFKLLNLRSRYTVIKIWFCEK